MSVHPPAAVVTYTASWDTPFSMRLRTTHWGSWLQRPEVPYLALCKLEKHCYQHVAELESENWGCGGGSSCGVNPWVLSLGTGAPMPRAWEDGMRSGFTSAILFCLGPTRTQWVRHSYPGEGYSSLSLMTEMLSLLEMSYETPRNDALLSTWIFFSPVKLDINLTNIPRDNLGEESPLLGQGFLREWKKTAEIVQSEGCGVSRWDPHRSAATAAGELCLKRDSGWPTSAGRGKLAAGSLEKPRETLARLWWLCGQKPDQWLRLRSNTI